MWDGTSLSFHSIHSWTCKFKSVWCLRRNKKRVSCMLTSWSCDCKLKSVDSCGCISWRLHQANAGGVNRNGQQHSCWGQTSYSTSNLHKSGTFLRPCAEGAWNDKSQSPKGIPGCGSQNSCWESEAQDEKIIYRGQRCTETNLLKRGTSPEEYEFDKEHDHFLAS